MRAFLFANATVASFLFRRPTMSNRIGCYAIYIKKGIEHENFNNSITTCYIMSVCWRHYQIWHHYT